MLKDKYFFWKKKRESANSSTDFNFIRTAEKDIASEADQYIEKYASSLLNHAKSKSWKLNTEIENTNI